VTMPEHQWAADGGQDGECLLKLERLGSMKPTTSNKHDTISFLANRASREQKALIQPRSAHGGPALRTLSKYKRPHFHGRLLDQNVRRHSFCWVGEARAPPQRCQNLTIQQIQGTGWSVARCCSPISRPIRLMISQHSFFTGRNKDSAQRPLTARVKDGLCVGTRKNV